MNDKNEFEYLAVDESRWEQIDFTAINLRKSAKLKTNKMLKKITDKMFHK